MTKAEGRRYGTTLTDYHNDINEVWNDLSRRAYQDLIEEETQEEDSVTHDLTKFPIILREHFDIIIPIEK